MTEPSWLEYHEEPVTLHSGDRSHWLVRGDLMFADERLREAVLAFWEPIVRLWSPPVEIISIPTGGDAWADALRARLGDWCMAGTEMPYRIVVDDVVTTGGSIFADGRAHMRLAVVDRRTRREGPAVSVWATMRLSLLGGNDGKTGLSNPPQPIVKSV